MSSGRPTPGVASAPLVLLVANPGTERDTLRWGLESHGYVTTCASTVADAWTKIVGRAIDVVIGDLALVDGPVEPFAAHVIRRRARVVVACREPRAAAAARALGAVHVGDRRLAEAIARALRHCLN